MRAMTVAAPHIPPEVFSANLDALRAVDPSLAARVAAVRVEDVQEPAVGRDGSLTLRIRAADGMTTWHGRTSMPTISAPAIVRLVDPGTAGVALPGIGHGLEARLLAERLAPQQAVFVFESDAGRLAAALRLNDLSDCLRGRRIILLCSDDVSAALDAFLAAHPGMLFPERIVAWPWLTLPETQRFNAALERAHLAHQHRRRARHQELAAALAARGERRLPTDHVRCVVHAHRAGAWTDDVLSGIPRAAGELGWTIEIIDGRDPLRADPLSLAEAAVRIDADFVLLLNAARGDSRAPLPRSVPVISYYVEPGLTARDDLAAVGEGDVVCAVDRQLGEYLRSAARAPDVQLVPLGAARACGMQDQPQSPAGVSRGSFDVVILQDAADLSPEAHGLTLGSPAAIWQTMCRICEANIDTMTGDWAVRLVELACRQLRLEIQDSTMRKLLARRFEAGAAPTLIAMACVRDLTAADCRVRLCGSGWQRHPAVKELAALDGAPAAAAAMAPLLGGIPLLVECDPRGSLSPAALAALASGCMPILRGDEAATGGSEAESRAGAASLPLPRWRRAADLRKLVRNLLRDPEGRAERVAQLSTQVHESHRLSHRLARLAQLLRRSNGRGADPRSQYSQGQSDRCE